MNPAATTEDRTPVATQPVLQARALTKDFLVRTGWVGKPRVLHAVDNVDLDLFPGEVTAIIGESGSGKSTVARLVAQLLRPTSGSVLLEGSPVEIRGSRAFRQYAAKVQLILQDPFASFNPVHPIGQQLRRVVQIHQPSLNAEGVERRVAELLADVNLAPAKQFADRYPHELSGGQRQRISIARALAAGPSVLLADEPVSMLDVSIRLGVLNLLAALSAERNLALLYITHDIASARYFAKSAAVMYAGSLVEGGPAEALTQNASHPYTQLLISAAPDPLRRSVDRIEAMGSPPDLTDPPSGCRFHPRCPFAMAKCRTSAPPPFPIAEGHWSRCWLHEGGHPPDLIRPTPVDLGVPESPLRSPSLLSPAPAEPSAPVSPPTAPSKGSQP